MTTCIAAAPDQEAATHIWGLWSALDGNGVLVQSTDLQAYPQGIQLTLVDPFHVVYFAIGHFWGVAAAYNAILLAGMATLGVSGALLAREGGGREPLGAALAMGCAPLLANAADGMTEGFGVGWVGISIALLVRLRRRPHMFATIAAGCAIGLTAWTGPYNLIWTILCACIVVLVHSIRRNMHVIRQSVIALAIAAIVASPVAWAIFGARQGNLPGSAARAGLPEIMNNPTIFRGGLRYGADLLDPFVPGPLTGGEADISHTAYLGICLLIYAIWGWLRDRKKRWPWLVLAATMVALSLGPYLMVRGEAVVWGNHPLAAPAGIAIVAVPLLGRITRWYRASAVAVQMLVPLASRAVDDARWQVVLVLTVLVDVLCLAPLAWPLTTTALPTATALAALPPGSALLELPTATSGQPPPNHWRDESVLLQTIHHHPIGGSMMGMGASPRAEQTTQAVRVLMRRENLTEDAAAAFEEQTFSHLLVHLGFHPLPPDARERLAECFGPPIHSDDRYLIHALHPVSPTCLPSHHNENSPSN